MNIEQATQHVSRTINISQSININQYLANNLRDQINHGENIGIYGAGKLGKQMLTKLRILGYEVTCFFDKNAKPQQEVLGIPCYRADDLNLDIHFRENIIVILAVLLNKENKEQVLTYLKKEKYKKIIERYSFLASMLPFSEKEVDVKKIFEREKKQIYDTLYLMNDEHSIDIFCSNLRAHGTYDYDQVLVSRNMKQYFDVKIPFSKGYAHFIDCGAYMGDSLQELVHYYDCKSYIGFEPDLDTYKTLSICAEDLINDVNSLYLFPAAVADKCYYTSFNSGNGDSSALSDNGNETVQVVNLDDVLKNVHITMIKMDIEGAEKNALFGAKRIIKQQKPDLAICVYHKLSDLWEIPLLLHEWVPDYKFYLRCHYDATMETVLYATI